MSDKSKNDSSIEARYLRAQAIEQASTTKNMVLNASLYPRWIGDSDCFWYERETKEGVDYRLVDAKAASNNSAFDHAALARALAKVSDKQINADDLPLTQVAITLSPTRVEFTAFTQRCIFDNDSGTCEKVSAPNHPSDWVLSPDGTQAVFQRDYNIWIRNLANGEERALTTDGERHYAYGQIADRMNANDGLYEGFSPWPALFQWSPDSKRLFTLQTDARKVKTLTFTREVPQDGSVRPFTRDRKVAWPGDEHVVEFRMLAIEVKTGRICPAEYPPLLDSMAGPSPFMNGCAWWAADGRRAYFVDMTLGYHVVRLVEFDTDSGATRVLFEETSETFISLNINLGDAPSFLYLAESNELIWFSERSGCGHLYLYDLATGELKNTITQGNWIARETLHFDAARRDLFIQVTGRVDGRDPYYREVCRVNIDSGEITTLASSDHDYVVQKPGGYAHAIMANLPREGAGSVGISPSGHYVVTTRSRADEPPLTELRDRDGKIIMALEAADVSGLPEGWQWPEPVKLTAADDKTDIYGLVFRPTDFSPDKQYPVIDYTCDMPYWSVVPKGSFVHDPYVGLIYMTCAALAELGFIVVCMDGRGSGSRDKAFQDECYGRIHTANNLADHVAGIQQLAERYPYMDLNRVGITGVEDGGGGAWGLLQFPDFYKVGVTWLFFDIRMSMTSLAERYQGLPDENDYQPSVLGTYAHKLKGKLLLIHSPIVMFNPVAGVYQLVQALMEANKDFDLLIQPNYWHTWHEDTYGLHPSHQGFHGCSYRMRRTWDYMVRHLLGVEPPADFKLTNGYDIAGEIAKAKRLGTRVNKEGYAEEAS